MKKILLPIILSAVLILSGCSTVKGIFGKNAAKEQKQATKIEQVDAAIAANSTSKLKEIGKLSWGVGYALSDVPADAAPYVFTTRDLNTRILSLSPTPMVDEINAMRTLVDEMNKQSKLATQLLQEKDDVITAIQTDTIYLEQQKNKEIAKYISIAQAAALKADSIKAELDKMDSWLGLGAIWYGIKKLVISSMWILGSIGVIFIILRIFAASNPIAGAIFSVFNIIGGYFIKGLKILLPKAIEFSGNIATSVYNESKVLLTKIVDSIEWIKQLEKSTGKNVTLKELFVELEKKMDKSEKDIIDKIKKDLGY